MAVIYKDRVKETSVSEGTGDFTLDGAATGFQSFDDAFGQSQDLYYVIELDDDWEVGIGQMSDAVTLVRSSVLASTNSDNAVDFPAGTKTVFSTVPAAYFAAAGRVNVSAGATSNNLTNMVFSNSNGLSFGLSGSTITGSHNGITDSSPFRLTADNSQLRFTSADSQLRFTSADSQLQFTSANSNFLGTGATASFRHTSADSQLQFTSANSNLLGTGATASFRHTSADSQLRFTSADSQLQFTSANSNFQFTSDNSLSLGTGATASFRFTSQNSQLQFTSANTKFVQEWQLAGNTAGTTSSAQGSQLYLAGGNMLTVSGSSNTISFSVNSASLLGTGATASFRHTSADSQLRFTSADSQLQFTSANSNFLGTGATASFRHTSADTQLRFTSADSQLRFTSNAIGAIGISTSGNTSGTTGSQIGTYWIEGGNNLTASQITSNNGSHTLVLSGVSFANSNNNTLSVNAGTLTASAPVKFSAGTASANLTNLTLSDSNGYSFGLNGSVVTAKGPYVGFLEPYPLLTATATLLPAAGSWYLVPFVAPNSMSGGRINVLGVNTGTANLFQEIVGANYASNSTGTLSQNYTFSGLLALFSQGTGTNSTRLESTWSNSYSWGWTKVVNVSTNAASNIAVSVAHSISYISDIGSDGAYTLNQYANAGSATYANSSSASTAASTVFSSGRNLISGSVVMPVGFNTTISAGNYWLGFCWSTTRNSASTGGLLGSAPDYGFSGLLGLSRLAVDSLYRNFGSTATTARSQLMPYGVYTAAAATAPPSAIAFSSDLSSLASQWIPYFNFNYRGLTK